MDKFIIKGGKKLSGKIRVSGSKNAILPIMTAALLAEGRSVLHNVPYLNDIKMMAHVLRVIGARVDFNDGTLEIDSTHCSDQHTPLVAAYARYPPNATNHHSQAQNDPAHQGIIVTQHVVQPNDPGQAERDQRRKQVAALCLVKAEIVPQNRSQRHQSGND